MNTLRPLIRRIVIAGMCFCLMLCGTSSLFAVTWEAYTAATCTLTHETVEAIPLPRTRTTIGIGEQVTCSITNWSDTDKKIVGDSTTYPSDEMGELAWSTNKGTVNPVLSSTTTYTAPTSDADTSATVTCNVFDSGTKGLDDAVNKQVTFTIIIPTGVKAYFNTDVALGNLGPPNNKIGAKSLFFVQILPDTVNFTNATVRENIPVQNFTWPDGTQFTRPAAIIGPVSPANFMVNGTVRPSIIGDSVSSGVDPKSRLDNGQGYQNFTCTIDVPFEFLGETNYVEFTTAQHPSAYTGATLKCKVSNEGVSGGDQGPWQN